MMAVKVLTSSSPPLMVPPWGQVGVPYYSQVGVEAQAPQVVSIDTALDGDSLIIVQYG